MAWIKKLLAKMKGMFTKDDKKKKKDKEKGSVPDDIYPLF